MCCPRGSHGGGAHAARGAARAGCARPARDHYVGRARARPPRSSRSLTYSWWFQAVRPEVYALEAALSAVILERAVYIESRFPLRDTHAVRVAAVAFGFALTTHHFLALLLLPALAPTMARVVLGAWRAARWPRLPRWWPSGLMLYHLPAHPRRAGSRCSRWATPRLRGASTGWCRRQAFQGNQGDGVPLPLGERFADVVHAAAARPAPTRALRSGAGSLRAAHASPRRAGSGVLLGLVTLVFVAGRAWLGFVRDNPDALGYLLPAFMALGLAGRGRCGSGRRASWSSAGPARRMACS
jgi:hypothetical protein